MLPAPRLSQLPGTVCTDAGAGAPRTDAASHPRPDASAGPPCPLGVPRTVQRRLRVLIGMQRLLGLPLRPVQRLPLQRDAFLPRSVRLLVLFLQPPWLQAGTSDF